MKTRNILMLVLVVLTIVTMGSVAGTYAKYTFSESIGDSARVAKWHVSNDDDYNAGIFLADYGDVKSSNGSNVMAPGTEGEYSFQLVGDVETDYTLDLKFSDVTDTINGTVNDSEGNAYSPIVYSFYSRDSKDAAFGDAVCTSTDINTFTACVTKTVNGAGDDGQPKVHKAGEIETPIYTFKWVWAFEQGQDAADTQLANMMYQALKNDETNKSEAYGVSFNVTVSATQYNAPAA